MFPSFLEPLSISLISRQLLFLESYRSTRTQGPVAAVRLRKSGTKVLHDGAVSSISPRNELPVVMKRLFVTTLWRGQVSIFLTPGSYQRLDLFNKVHMVLCPNLTDAQILAPLLFVHEQEFQKTNFLLSLSWKLDRRKIITIIPKFLLLKYLYMSHFLGS